MAETRINLDGVILSTILLSDIICRIDKAQANIKSIGGQIDSAVLSRNNLSQRLFNQVDELTTLEEKLKTLKSVTELGANNFKAVDDLLAGNTIHCDISDGLAEYIYSMKSFVEIV